MKIILMNAISLDGFIADTSGGTDWINDLDDWKKCVEEQGNMAIGRTTYEEIKDELPEGVTCFVLSSRDEQDKAGLVFCKTVENILIAAHEKGIQRLLLCGGGKTNASFAKANLIDEIILDIHPLLLGKGVLLFDTYTPRMYLELITTAKNDAGFVKNHYQVKARQK